MARAKYTITPDDAYHATFYLSDRIRNHDIKFRNSVPHVSAEADYRVAVDEKSKTKRAAAINTWCEMHLAGSDWKRLKAAIRKRRERWLRSEDVKTISISLKAHQLLVRISKRDVVTFSEILQHYLGKALNSNRGRTRR